MRPWAAFTNALEDDNIESTDEYFSALYAAKRELISELNEVTEPTTWFWSQLVIQIDSPGSTIAMLMESEELHPQWHKVLRKLYPKVRITTREPEMTGDEPTRANDDEEKRNSLLLGQDVTEQELLMTEVMDAIDDLKLEPLHNANEGVANEGFRNEEPYFRKPRLQMTECRANCKLEEWAEFLMDFHNDVKDFGIQTDAEKIRYFRRCLSKGSQERVYLTYEEERLRSLNEAPTLVKLANSVTVKKAGTNQTEFWEHYADQIKQRSSTANEYVTRFLKAKYLCSTYGNINMGVVKFKRGLSSRLRRALEGVRAYNDLETLIEYVLEIDFDQQFNDSLESADERAHPVKKPTESKPHTHKKSSHHWVCFYCGREKHKVYECKQKKNDERRGKVRPREDWAYPNGRFSKKAKRNNNQEEKENAPDQANAVIDDDEHHDNDLAFMMNESPNSHVWAIDSGATSHMTGDRSLLTNLRTIPTKKVELADGRHLEYNECGTLALRVASNGKRTRKLTLSEVKVIPGLEVNLISVRRLVEKGCTVQFKLNKKGQNQVEILNDTTLVLQGQLVGSGLYVPNNIVNDAALANKEVKRTIDDVHAQLGHIGMSTIRKMNKLGMVTYEPEDEKERPLCDACMKGKMCQSISRVPAERRKVKGEMLHMDLIGPISPNSVGAMRYVLTIVDDLTRMRFVALLKSKDETYDKFEVLYRRMATMSSINLKTIRTDDGTEFVNKRFNDAIRDKSYHPDNDNAMMGQELDYDEKQSECDRLNDSESSYAVMADLLDSEYEPKSYAEALASVNAKKMERRDG